MKQRKQRVVSRDGDTITKKLTFPLGEIDTTAGGIIALNTSVTSAAVQSEPATEWASFAARYQQFRVKSTRLIMEPAFPASGSPTAAIASHKALYVSDYIGTAAPGSAAQVLSDERAIVTSTARRVNFTTTWARNPNARLWNPTFAALPAANSMGIAFASDVTGNGPASTVMYTTVVEWIVEFRGSQ